MLQQLKADIADVEHPFLQVAIRGFAKPGAEVLAAGDNRLCAAQSVKQPVEQMLTQGSIGRQRTMRFKDGAGGTVVVQQAEFDIPHQEQQSLIQQRLLLFNTAGSGQRPEIAKRKGLQMAEPASRTPSTDGLAAK